MAEGSNPMTGQRTTMSDELETAVAKFLNDYKRAMTEYEKGYADADATLSVVDSHVDELREAQE
ncbi:hypothetical protein C439_02182 [Haloferax mediterranei ATCC 33500]|uniref:Uncharacterized protein n=2 Tax=Haloferax mediterranei (strain ATCC 33500 / DSM 1411 / JCM 8866 / NBRC 14739 / NCIMB 2177 / R-4) TaxID=523841 RepID=M0J9Q4_HALMT|nr:hypothetical protein C439_02182 [Haloferax mediterranei ATCC 33500]